MSLREPKPTPTPTPEGRCDKTELARSPLLLLDFAAERGLDAESLMREAGIREQQLRDPDARVPFSSMRPLWDAVIRRAADPTLGLSIGSSLRTRQFGIVGYVMYYSPSLGMAFRDLCRYVRIISEAAQLTIVFDDDVATLRSRQDPSLHDLRHPAETDMAAAVAVARELTGTELVPARVRLTSPRPADDAPYRAMFRTKVEFDCAFSELALTSAQRAVPTVAADSALAGYLHELADIRLAELGPAAPTLVCEVRNAILVTLPHGKPEIRRVAESMGLSSRTLQRKLREAGTSFSSILESLRRELSDELRQNRGFSASEVAFLLGYSESSAYQRAARRWREMS